MSEEDMVGWCQGGYEKIWSVPGGCTVSEENGEGRERGHQANSGLRVTWLLNHYVCVCVSVV